MRGQLRSPSSIYTHQNTSAFLLKLNDRKGKKLEEGKTQRHIERNKRQKERKKGRKRERKKTQRKREKKERERTQRKSEKRKKEKTRRESKDLREKQLEQRGRILIREREKPRGRESNREKNSKWESKEPKGGRKESKREREKNQRKTEKHAKGAGSKRRFVNARYTAWIPPAYNTEWEWGWGRPPPPLPFRSKTLLAHEHKASCQRLPLHSACRSRFRLECSFAFYLHRSVQRIFLCLRLQTVRDLLRINQKPPPKPNNLMRHLLIPQIIAEPVACENEDVDRLHGDDVRVCRG